jgi:hypothetical protein
MNSVCENQIEKLYDISANSGIVVEQTINGLLRVFVTDKYPKAEKWATADKITALHDYGISDVVIAAAVQATTAQMIANVDILNTRSTPSDTLFKIFGRKDAPQV